MNYRPLKKDLTEATKICHFCNRPLNSLTAFILENESSKEIIYSGPKCAEKNIDPKYTLKLLPDFTKYTLSNNIKERFSNKEKSNYNLSNYSHEELNLRKAIEYLELRENKLIQEFNTSCPILNTYYMYYINNKTLNSTQIQHILNIENKASNNLKLTNLQKCYNYIFWINKAIYILEDKANEFLIPIKIFLIKYYRITENQKNGVNKWLENLEGIPQLK